MSAGTSGMSSPAAVRTIRCWSSFRRRPPGHRDLLCELLLEASRRKVNFRAVGAYRFEICHDEHLLCDYLLLHTLLEELYVQAAQKGVSGAPKCRLKC